VAVFVVVALGVAAVLAQDEEAGASDGVASRGGLYLVDFEADPASSPVNRLHTWELDLHDRDGDAVSGARITVAGDMPAHGHGLPTQPLVRDLGDGAYAIEGMKFQMGGRWFVELQVDGPEGPDAVRVDFDLVP
jgi:YtkA-like